MNDCEKCKYYHDNCDSKFRCRIDVEKIKADAIEEIFEKANEIQKQQIENLNQSNRKNGKMWARYMVTYLGHIQNACTRLLKEKQND